MVLAQKNYSIEGDLAKREEEMLYTIEDIEALPEDERVELIDGRLYMMGIPTTTHQRIVNYINFGFSLYIREKNGDCEIFIPPFAVYLNEKDNYVEPDITVICKKDKIDEKGCHGGPDLIIEVVSPSSVRMDYMLKLFKYRTYGVREYWIVDPDKKRVQVYDMEHDDMMEYIFSDDIPVGIYEGDLKINLAEFL